MDRGTPIPFSASPLPPTEQRLPTPAAWGSGLERSILATAAYADIFDTPRTAAEMHRYLVGTQASPEQVSAGLAACAASGRLVQAGDMYCLPGREAIVQTRQRRERAAARLWPRAAWYGRAISGLPFVRMVAVTGSLAVNNAECSADLDYLVVTRPGRLWLARAVVILLVRMAAQRGDRVCPNYFLSEQALALADRSLFAAHELVQMAPLSGTAVYRAMRRANPWADTFLPNAGGPGRLLPETPGWSRPVQATLEAALRTPPGGWLERWEMERKVRRFSRLVPQHPEAEFGPDRCKGHFDDHGQRVRAAYALRLRALGMELYE